MEEKRLIKKKEKAFTDGNQEQLATACNDLGDYYNQQGKYDDAVSEYQQEAKIYQKLGRRLEMAKANRMIGEMYMLLCEFEKALKHINIYLKIVEKLGNQIEMQRSYATLGRAHLLNGQSQIEQPAATKFLKQAEKAFIKSLLICKDLTGQISKIELLDMQARLYLNIGVVKEHMEDFEEAICYLEKAIKIAKSNDIFELLHHCYTSASLLYHYKKNDSTLALRFCNLALEVAKRLPNRTKKQCETLILKSEIMIKVGDFQSAKQTLHKAYKLNTPDLNDRKNVIKTLKIVVALCYTLDSLVTTSSVDYSTRKKLYEKMGDGCSLLQNYEKAIDYYLKMLECAEISCDSTKDLIPVYVSLYQTNPGFGCICQISKIELLDMQARLYLNIGVVKEHMEDFEEAICYLEKAIKIAKSNDIFELLHHCYTSASLLYHYKKNDSTLALRFCNLALEVAKRLPNRTKKQCETLILKSEIMIKVGDFQSAKQTLHKAYKLNTPDLNDRKNVIKTLKIVVALCYTLDSLVTTSSVDYSTRKKLYEKMGDGCSLLQNYEKAIDYYLKMLECAEISCDSTKDLIPVYVSLYQTYKDNKQYDHALEYLWKELDLNKHEPIEAFNTFCNIGEVYELQLKPFWVIHDIYQKALEEAKKCSNLKLEKIALVRLVKIHEKYNMESLLDVLKEQSVKRGIDLSEIDEDDEDCSDHNTPDIGDDICLDDLTDSNSESEDDGKQLTSRRRGTCLTIKRNNKGETQLHQACISGNLSLARRLIDQGHAVNVRDHAGWLPLHEACNHGYRDIVELLLDRGAASAINDKGGTNCDGITPLYDACSNGFLDVVELLLERGANATLLTDFGDNCLNILDKWRNSVELNNYEQIQYERVRSLLFQQVTQAGVVERTKTSQSPITNETCSKSNSRENSLDKLRQIAYSSDSDSDREDIYSSQNISNSNKTQSNYLDSVSPLKRNPSILKESNVFSSKTPSKFNAKNEYKNVMERVKHPNRTDIIGSDCRDQFKKRKSGFLEPDEVDDDWLDDDSDQTRKKRKCLTERPTTSVRYNSEYSDTLNQDYLSLPISNDNFGLFDEIDNNCSNAFQVLLEPNKQKITQKTKSSKVISSKNKTRRTKSQTSLLDSGFSRYRSESPIFNDNSSEHNSNEPDSTTISTAAYLDPINEIPQNSIQPTPAVMTSFKIKIEDEMLLVPVESKRITELNIRWLADEASRRYYNLVGLRPVLRLMTADGFAFEESDTISVAQNENMISSKVLEWKISPLAQRYEEMCSQLNASLNLDIKGILEKAQVSNTVSLRDFCLMPETVEPLFKSLVHQTTLRALDLSNNFIQNDGCKQLVKALSTLKQLKILNLEGNCITAEGIRILISPTCDLPEIEELNLSFNPIGSESVEILDRFCKTTQKLKSLKLSSCNINSFYDYDLQFFNLSNLDISFNIINAENLLKVFKKLNSSKLENLNISFTVRNYSLGSKLGELLDGGTCENCKRIELAGCQLVDTEIYRIVQNLTKAKNLEYLDMSENPRLTLTSLQYILENLGQLKKILLLQCTQIFTDQLENITLNDFVKVPELIALSVKNTESQLDVEEILKKFWEKYYGDKGKIQYLNNNIYLYINECDLFHV